MIELKQCPFCGETNFKLESENTFTEEEILTKTYPHIMLKKRKTILKLSCPCGCSFEKEAYDVDDFKKQWNTRFIDNTFKRKNV